MNDPHNTVDTWQKKQEVDFSTRGIDISSRSINTSRVKKALKLLKSNKSTIDLGCNDGSITNLISQKNNQVIGIDLPEVVKIAKKRFPSIKFSSFDLNKEFPLPESSFDQVFATEIIEHIVDDKKFLKECFRILKEDGNIILSTPNAAFIRDRIWLLFGRYLDGDTHIHRYTFRNLRKLLIEVGFKIIKEVGVVYDLGEKNFFLNFIKHFKFGYQNPFWYLVELISPRRLRSCIIIKARKATN